MIEPLFIGTPGDAMYFHARYGRSKEKAQNMPFENLEAIIGEYCSELNKRNFIMRGLHWLATNINPDSFAAYENTYNHRKMTEQQTSTGDKASVVKISYAIPTFSGPRVKAALSKALYIIYREQAQDVPLENIKAFLDGYYSVQQDKNFLTKAIYRFFEHIGPSPFINMYILAYEDVYRSRTTGNIHG